MRKARNFQNIPNSDLFCFHLDSGFQQVSDNPFPICENIKLLSKLKLMDSLAIENIYMTVSIRDGHTRLSLSHCHLQLFSCLRTRSEKHQEKYYFKK